MWHRQVVVVFLTFSIYLSSHFTDAQEHFYSYFVTDARGNKVALEQYSGKVTLVVNVASECGFTDKHYKGLVRLKQLLDPNRFEILAFPCNQFGHQEPKEAEEIVQWAKQTYGVNFPIFSKINVVNEDVPEAWEYLRDETGHAPSWNFWKYLVNHKGVVERYWGPWSDIEEITLHVKTAIDAAYTDINDEGRVPGTPWNSRPSTGPTIPEFGDNMPSDEIPKTPLPPPSRGRPGPQPPAPPPTHASGPIHTPPPPKLHKKHDDL